MLANADQLTCKRKQEDQNNKMSNTFGMGFSTGSPTLAEQEKHLQHTLVITEWELGIDEHINDLFIDQ